MITIYMDVPGKKTHKQTAKFIREIHQFYFAHFHKICDLFC